MPAWSYQLNQDPSDRGYDDMGLKSHMPAACLFDEPHEHLIPEIMMPLNWTLNTLS